MTALATVETEDFVAYAVDALVSFPTNSGQQTRLADKVAHFENEYIGLQGDETFFSALSALYYWAKIKTRPFDIIRMSDAIFIEETVDKYRMSHQNLWGQLLAPMTTYLYSIRNTGINILEFTNNSNHQFIYQLSPQVQRLQLNQVHFNYGGQINSSPLPSHINFQNVSNYLKNELTQLNNTNERNPLTRLGYHFNGQYSVLILSKTTPPQIIEDTPFHNLEEYIFKTVGGNTNMQQICNWSPF